ncbi:hypothetical protein [Pseudoduganella violaceinigra]|uniref:hypothetical protein n=1 Tax=Pseudoduganella violaceinigra TaxID=246602 RepID=UPI0004079EFB|nr:hypothetical protein [Pseudoduganella violaceinigra]
MNTTADARDPDDIYEDLTLKTCHISQALDLAINALPEKYEHVASTLFLLQGSLKDVNKIAAELRDRGQS